MLTSPRRYHAEEGRDLDDIRYETATDNAASIRTAKKIAMEINAEFDDDQPCHWRDIIPLMPPEAVQANLDTKEEPEPMKLLTRKAVTSDA
jgi:hypothetical protein